MDSIPAESADSHAGHKTGPRERIPRPRRADVRRRLLDAARVQFAEHGYGGTSLDMIANYAGFTKGAIYSNFETKERLFVALMDESIQDRISTITAALCARPSNDATQMQHLGDMLMQAAANDQDWQLLFIEFWITAVRNPEIGADFVAYRNRMIDILAQEVEGWIGNSNAGDLTPREVAVAILGLSNGLNIEHITNKSNVPDGLLGRILSKVIAGT